MNINTRNLGKATNLKLFTAYPFVMDGIHCKCMESFLYSLKYDNIIIQRLVCDLSAEDARRYCTEFTWNNKYRLYWRGTSYKKHSREFYEFIIRVFDSLYKNPDFKAELKEICSEELTNFVVKNLKSEIVLTKREAVFQLHRLHAKI